MVSHRQRFAKFAIGCGLIFGLSSASAEPVTMERIEKLPAAEQAAWKDYLARSQAGATANRVELEAELAAHGMTSAVKAPDGGDFRLSHGVAEDWNEGPEAGKLADIVISYQAPCGGWSKHTGYSKGPRTPGMQWSSQYDPGKPPHYLCTFDNKSTTEQMHLLANVWNVTKRQDCRAALVKGLDFILTAQYPNGGWPQVYPIEGGYHDSITLNDDAATHILELLYAIGQNEPRFAFLEDAQRDKAAAACEKGLACLLKAQVLQDGVKTGWCAQHDAITLAPAGARAFEPASLSGMESASLLKFLMTIPHPSPELVQSIEAGLAWLEKVTITGLTRTRRNGKNAYDPDPNSTTVFWARFYDVKTNKPLFEGRNGQLYETFNEMAAENPVAYDYLSTGPGSIVTNGQKKWRKMLEKEKMTEAEKEREKELERERQREKDATAP